MLAELMDARVDIQECATIHPSERLLADMEYFVSEIRENAYTLEYGEISDLIILQDDAFSLNHETEIVGTVDYPRSMGHWLSQQLMIQNRTLCVFEKVGEISG